MDELGVVEIVEAVEFLAIEDELECLDATPNAGEKDGGGELIVV